MDNSNFPKIKKISIDDKDFKKDIETTLIKLVDWYRDLGYPFTHDERQTMTKTIDILRTKINK